MAIAADKIKNLLDEARDEALKQFSAMAELLVKAGQEGLNAEWKMIVDTQNLVAPMLQRIEAYKQVLELDVVGAPSVAVRPVAPAAPPMPTASRTTFDAQGRIVEQSVLTSTEEPTT